MPNYTDSKVSSVVVVLMFASVILDECAHVIQKAALGEASDKTGAPTVGFASINELGPRHPTHDPLRQPSNCANGARRLHKRACGDARHLTSATRTLWRNFGG